jgi:hypothetical protein
MVNQISAVQRKGWNEEALADLTLQSKNGWRPFWGTGKTLEETFAGEDAVKVTVKIPKSLFVMSRAQQVALQHEMWGYETFEHYVVAALHDQVIGDGEYLKNGALTGASIDDLTEEERRLVRLVPGGFR